MKCRALPKNGAVHAGKVGKEFPGEERTEGFWPHKGSPGTCRPAWPWVSASISCAIPRCRGHQLRPAIALSLPTVIIHRAFVFPGNLLPLDEPAPPNPVVGISGGPWPRLSH